MHMVCLPKINFTNFGDITTRESDDMPREGVVAVKTREKEKELLRTID